MVDSTAHGNRSREHKLGGGEPLGLAVRTNTVREVREVRWQGKGTRDVETTSELRRVFEVVYRLVTLQLSWQRSHLPALSDEDVLRRLLSDGPGVLDLLDHVHAVDHLPEDDMFVVQKGRCHGRDEELAPVAVRSRILIGARAGAGFFLELVTFIARLDDATYHRSGMVPSRTGTGCGDHSRKSFDRLVEGRGDGGVTYRHR